MYRTLQVEMWQDPWFVELKPQTKCLFMYLITNPRVNQCGAMEVSVRQIEFETGINARQIPAEMAALGDKVAWWRDENVIVVRNWYRHQRSQSSENFTKAARKVFATLPGFTQAYLSAIYPELQHGMDTENDTHPQPIPNPSPTQGDKETVTVTVTAAVTETGSEPEESPLPPKGEAFDPEFLEFWNAYPKGFGSKSKSYTAWKRIRHRHPEIMACLAEWKRSERWAVKRMVKTCELWLRDDQWENPPPIAWSESPGPPVRDWELDERRGLVETGQWTQAQLDEWIAKRGIRHDRAAD